MIKLLVFDFDGTLIDSSNDIVNATNELLNNYDLPSLDKNLILSSISHGFGDLIYHHFKRHFKNENFSEKFHNKVESYFYEIYESHYLNEVSFMPGAIEFLQSYSSISKGLKIAILTNKSIQKTLDIVKHLKIDHLPWIEIFGRDSFEHYKPHPFPLNKIMSSAGVTPKETLMIGDGTPDIGVAKNAGAISVAVDFGFTPIETLKQEEPDYVISSFEGLKEIILTAAK